MSRQASKTLIGGFVVGALALVVIGVLLFGGGRFWKERPTYVMFFEGSVKGLSIGAPVIFRGVRVGSVMDIFMYFDGKDLSVRIPVLVELGEGKVEAVNMGSVKEIQEGPIAASPPIMEEMIKRGLRAQLQMQSFVTGQLLIALDFYPNTPALMMGAMNEYHEIPTIPTPLQTISRKLEDIPLEQMIARLNSSLDGIDRLLNAPELAESIANLNQALKEIQNLVRNVDGRIEPLSAGIQEAVKDYSKLAKDMGRRIEPLASGGDEALKSIGFAVRRADKVLGKLEGLFSEDSLTMVELKSTLKEFSAAARSIRLWADYLERHPEALIRGKGDYRR